MNYRWIVGLSIGLINLLLPSNSKAISLYFSPSSATTFLGNPVSMDIFINGLGEQQPPSLGAFDIDISFDNTILSFNQAQFGTQLDLGNFGSIQNTNTPTVNTINIAELSLEESSLLNTTQPASFRLATLTFNTLSVGMSTLNFSRFILSDAEGSPLLVSTTNGLITISPPPINQVPEASFSISLIILGLVSITMFPYRA
jgi:hypothetical protein